jgi:hypothetical protein
LTRATGPATVPQRFKSQGACQAANGPKGLDGQSESADRGIAAAPALILNPHLEENCLFAGHWHEIIGMALPLS